jgi:tripartite-type tricarboxylate transporter receptor subunit TctC
MRSFKYALAIGAALLGLASATVSYADDFPNRPVSLVVGFTPGGESDTGARGIIPFWEKELGQPIVVDSRPGAAMQVSLEYMNAMPHDGYTVFWHNQMYLSVIELTDPDVPYKTDNWIWFNVQDNDPATITVNSSSPWKTLDDLIADIKARPGEVTIGYITGSAQLLACKTLFDKVLGLDYREVPQQGGGPMRTSLAGQQVDVICSNARGDYALGDQARTLAVFTDNGSVLQPDAQSVNQVLEKMGRSERFPDLGSLRGPAVQRDFAEKYPDRFKKLYDSYQRAVNSDAFKKWAKDTGRDAITSYLNVEQSTDVIKKYDQFFKDNRDVIVGD